MIDILFNPKRAQRHPLEMMLVAIFYSSISIFLAVWIFPKDASIVLVFLTVLSCIYVIQGAFKLEEKKDKQKKNETYLLKEHFRLLLFLLFLFVGFVISFSFWSFVLPSELIKEIFSSQIAAVDLIRSAVTGNAIAGNGFIPIIINNFKVLLVSLVFALFFGAGSIFILVWNASVMGFVIGNLAKETLGIVGIPIAFAKYFIHGIPEMLGYLTISLAGGIIYVSIWRGDIFNDKKRKRIIIDSLVLIFISIFILIIAALIEVYVSPYI